MKEVILGPDGVAEAARPGSIVVDMSTISPKVARECQRRRSRKRHRDARRPGERWRHRRQGRHPLDHGRGRRPTVERCRGVFEAMGKKITHVGGPGMRQLHQTRQPGVGGPESVGDCEALTFAAKAGAYLEKVLDAVSEGRGRSWQLSNLGPKMVEARLPAGLYGEAASKGSEARAGGERLTCTCRFWRPASCTNC